MKKVRPLIVGNWKSFVTTPKEGVALLKGIDKRLPRGLMSDLIVCPPAPLLAHLRSVYRGRSMGFGVQDVSSEDPGAHTGEVSVELALASGASYAIIGHAERRAMGEVDEVVAKKVRAALDGGLKPILCVGESVRDRDGRHFEAISAQISASLARMSPQEISKIVIAYEPVWAIGGAVAPPARTVAEALVYVRKTLATLYDRDTALKTRVIYGGAVDETSAADLLGIGTAAGFLVGRASVDSEHFIGVVRACQ